MGGHGCTPTTARGKASREQIVQAAALLMQEHGVAGTSNEDIREAAGVSNSQLYHYFADKGDLVHAVVAYQVSEKIKEQRELLCNLNSFADIEKWRDSVVALAVKKQRQNCSPVGSLASELANHDEIARAALANGFVQWKDLIRDGLQGMRDLGKLSQAADPEALALAVLTVLQGGFLLVQTQRDVAPLVAGLDLVLENIRSNLTGA